MAEKPTEVAGKPIRGDYSANEIFEKEQKPFTEILPALDAALQLPGVKRIEWRQYTPYFNDGDPCVFSVEMPSFVVDHNGEEREFGDYADYTFEDYEEGYDWNSGHSWEERNKHKTTTIDGIDYSAHHKALTEVENIEHGHYDRDMLRLFGDHARVTYDGTGFDVEYFEHD